MARLLQGPGTFAQPSQLMTKKVAVGPGAQPQEPAGGRQPQAAGGGVDLLSAMLDHAIATQMKKAAAQAPKGSEDTLLRPDQLLSGSVPEHVLNPQAARPAPMSREQIHKLLTHALQPSQPFFNAVYALYLERLNSASMP